MSTLTHKLTKKCPWVPPPGKSRKPDKVPAKMPPESSAQCDSTSHEEQLRSESSDVTFTKSNSDFEEHFSDTNVHLLSIKTEMKLLTTHFNAVKQISHFLNGFFRSHGIQDRDIVESLNEVAEKFKEFIFEFDELEYTVALVENTLLQNKNPVGHCKMLRSKDMLLTKLLQSYSIIVTILQVVIQKQISQDRARFLKEHDLLRKESQINENKCISQTAVAKDLERKCSILQGKANALESYNSTLHQTVSELQTQLMQKDTQIKFLSNEVSSKTIQKQFHNDSEKLLEVIEELKQRSLAEKTALKKAVKVEKLRINEMEKFVKKAGRELKEKEEMLFELASQRDKLKLHLTLANNSNVEEKNRLEEMRSQLAKAQESRIEKELVLQKHQDISKYKEKELESAIEEKSKLQKSVERISCDLEKANAELNRLKGKSNVNILDSGNSNGNLQEVMREIQKLVLSLQETQGYLKNIQRTASLSRAINSEESVLSAVEEIKKHLQELKNFISPLTEKEHGGKDYRALYEQSSKDVVDLKSQVENMEALKTSFQGKNSSNAAVGDYSLRSFELEENRRLRERERALERQLDEVKEKLQKKELENIRLFNLEEELRSKKAELGILDRKKEEDCERLLGRMKELQEALDKKSTECDGLNRYIEMLKKSFYNVFGPS